MKLAARFSCLVLLSVAIPVTAQPDPFIRPLPPAAAGTEMLGKLLRDLAYEPKALSPDVFQITVEHDRWPVHIMLSLSTDGRRIWLECKFAPIEDPDRAPPQAWKRLLEANEKIGPAHFAFDAGDKRIHLYKSFDNHALTTDRLKLEIDHFDTTVRKTQDYWRGDHFKPVIASTELPAPPARRPSAPANAPEPPAIVSAERLMGEWQVVEIHSKGRKTPDDVLNARKPSLTFRNARDGDFGPIAKGKVMAELRVGPDSTRTVYVRLDAAGPSQIDFIDDQERVEPGIYRLDEETLTLCFAGSGERRPAEISTTEKQTRVIVLKRGQ
jgi:uncharacterized protein (TIGR03067 family)